MNKPLSGVLRWVAVLPTAYLGAGLAHLIVILVNQVSFAWILGPGSLLGEVFIRTVGNAVFGIALVWIGVRVAPSHARLVAVFLAGVNDDVKLTPLRRFEVDPLRQPAS